MNSKDLWQGYRELEGVLCKPGAPAERTAFSEDAAAMLMRVEDSSWWFQYRVDIIGKVAEKYLDKTEVIFDIGGGNGYSSRYLQQQGWETVLLEPSLPECINAKSRGVETVVCNALNDNDFPPGSVPQAVMLDVLEHIEDEQGMLKLLYTRVRSGGAIVFTVPAYRCLWSSEDDAAGHFRRYRCEELVRLLEEAGFRILYSSYLFSFLWLPILLFRAWAEQLGLLKRVDERSEEEKHKIQDRQFRHPGKAADWLLGCFEKFERSRIMAGKTLPFGSSVLIVARK